MIIEQLRKARTMSWQDWGLLLEAARVALVIEIALRVLPFDTLLARLEAVGTSHVLPASRVACAHAVRRAYRLLPLQCTCLKESLVLFRLLRRRGAKVQFRLGVRKEGTLLAAHAWVDGEGAAVGDRGQKAYLSFPVPLCTGERRWNHSFDTGNPKNVE
jgi:hypothetical protein